MQHLFIESTSFDKMLVMTEMSDDMNYKCRGFERIR